MVLSHRSVLHTKPLVWQKIEFDVSKFFLVSILILMVLSQSAFVFALQALERSPASNPRLVNAFGERVIEHVNVNQQVQLTADIKNNQEVSQNFVYIVQVKDSRGIVIYISWITGRLEPDQSFSPALSWTPHTSGTYIAEIFVWDSLANQDALSESLSIKIISS